MQFLLEQLLRVCLGRDRRIRLFGPSGILRSVENRIGAHTWNLVEDYTNDFALFVVDIDGNLMTRRYRRCRTAFQAEEIEKRFDFSGLWAVFAEDGGEDDLWQHCLDPGQGEPPGGAGGWIRAW